MCSVAKVVVLQDDGGVIAKKMFDDVGNADLYRREALRRYGVWKVIFYMRAADGGWNESSQTVVTEAMRWEFYKEAKRVKNAKTWRKR